MSVWTKANIKFIVRGAMLMSDIESNFGFMEEWEHFKVFDKRNEYNSFYEPIFFLPKGSEGSLDILVKKTTKKKTVFCICGALRDCGTTKYITDWFNSVVNSNKGMLVKAKGYAQSDIDSEPTLYNYSDSYKNRVRYFISNIIWDIKCIFL